MNLKEYFKNYPKSTLLKVGDKYFLSSAKSKAQSYARLKGIEIEEVTKPTTKKSSQPQNTGGN